MAIKKVLKRTQNNRGLNTIPVTHKRLNRWPRAGKVTPQLPGDPRLLLSEYSATLDMWPPPMVWMAASAPTITSAFQPARSQNMGKGGMLLPFRSMAWILHTPLPPLSQTETLTS